MENNTARSDTERMIRFNPRIVPSGSAVGLVIIHQEHMIGKDSSETEF